MNFLDILITSPQYFYKNSMIQDRRICSLILMSDLSNGLSSANIPVVFKHFSFCLQAVRECLHPGFVYQAFSFPSGVSLRLQRKDTGKRRTFFYSDFNFIFFYFQVSSAQVCFF